MPETILYALDLRKRIENTRFPNTPTVIADKMVLEVT